MSFALPLIVLIVGIFLVFGGGGRRRSSRQSPAIYWFSAGFACGIVMTALAQNFSL